MEELTYRLFMVGTVGMLAATVYLLMASREVDAKYRRGVYISALVTGIAYYHYNKMTASYALNPGEFDTGLRYVDWVLTVPLMFVEIIAITSVGAVATKKFRDWGFAGLVMIGAGYFGEISEASSTNYWIGFVLAMAAYSYLMFQLQNEGEGMSGDELVQFNKIKNLIFIGWIIYPLGYISPVLGTDLGALRELLYNVADIVNKVGLGVLVLGLARIKSGEKINS